MFPELLQTSVFLLHHLKLFLFHISNYSLIHLIYLCFTEHLKIHFIFSFQNVCNPGDHAVQTIPFDLQHFFLG